MRFANKTGGTFRTTTRGRVLRDSDWDDAVAQEQGNDGGEDDY